MIEQFRHNKYLALNVMPMMFFPLGKTEEKINKDFGKRRVDDILFKHNNIKLPF